MAFPTRARRRRRAAFLVSAMACQGLAAIAAVVVPTVVTPVAAGAGGPTPPVLLFAEDFENVGPATSAVHLPNYVGLPPVGQTYTADGYWLSAADCNGYIVSFLVNQIPGCGANAASEIGRIAYALGVIGNNSPYESNHSVAAHTHIGTHPPGTQDLEIEAQKAVPVAENHYILFSVDAASINCLTNPAKLAFYLVSASGTEIPAYNTPIDACNDPRARIISVPPPLAGNVSRTYVGGRFFSDKAIYNASSCRFRMRNKQPLSNGNDHGFDNIRCWDATPKLEKTFSPSTLPSGGTSTLTFTITNTSDLAAKEGWQFTDALPAGLRVTNPAATTTCAGAAVNARPGGPLVIVRGDLRAGQASCTVTVYVTSAYGGIYRNGPANVASQGLNVATDATVTFISSMLKVCKVAGSGVAIGTPFTFTAGAATVSVPAGAAPGGYCVMIPNAGPPNALVTVKEAAVAGNTIGNIAVLPPSRQIVAPNLGAGTVVVQLGSGVTEVVYTDRAAAQVGYLEICKQGTVAGTFSFTVAPGGSTPVVVPNGLCSGALEVPAGSVTVTEASGPESALVQCFTVPAERQGTCNRVGRASAVSVPVGDTSNQTIAVFVNAPSSDGSTGGGGDLPPG